MKTSANTTGKEYMFRGEECELGIYSVGQSLVLGMHAASVQEIQQQILSIILIWEIMQDLENMLDFKNTKWSRNSTIHGLDFL